MSAPWEGELRAADGFAEWICDAEGVDVAQAHETVTSEGGEIARALVHRANAYPKLVAELEAAVPLLQTLGSVALKAEVADHLPYGVLEEILAWFRDRNPGAVLASTKEEG